MRGCPLASFSPRAPRRRPVGNVAVDYGKQLVELKAAGVLAPGIYDLWQKRRDGIERDQAKLRALLPQNVYV